MSEELKFIYWDAGDFFSWSYTVYQLFYIVWKNCLVTNLISELFTELFWWAHL